MYRDLVYRPTEESYGTRDFVFLPETGGGLIAEKPADPGIDERPRTYNPDAVFGQDFMNKIDQAGRKAKAFLDMYMATRGNFAPTDVAGLTLPMVDPADVDPVGPESPEALARMDEYLRIRRQRGDFERARQRLIQQGFPLGGI